jgi:hypothetical protein
VDVPEYLVFVRELFRVAGFDGVEVIFLFYHFRIIYSIFSFCIHILVFTLLMVNGVFI